jgi:hypothetical protein
MTAQDVQSRAPGHSAWQRQPVLSSLATAVFVWALLVTTVESVAVTTTYMSRTREVMTFYLVVVVVVIALPWRRWSLPVRVAVGAMSVQIGVGFAFWSASEGSRTAINYWSQWLLALAFLLLGLTYTSNCWWLWKRIILGYGLLMALLLVTGLLFWHSPPAVLNGPAEFYGDRPIGAPATLIMVAGIAIAATDRELPARWRTVIVAAMGASVVLAQHRSVWVALGIVLLVLALAYFRNPEWVTDVKGLLVTAGCFVLAALLPVLTPWSVLPGSSGSGAGAALPASFESTGTFRWRLDMWESRLTQDRSLVDWLVGGTFGPNPVWGPQALVSNPTISSHSMLVDLLSMLGVLGLAVFVFLVARGTAFRWSRIIAAPVCLLGFLGYGLFYAWPAWAWVFIGAAVVAREETARQ